MAGNFVEELVAFLGWEVDSKELTQFGQDAESVKNTIKTMAAAVGVAAVGLSAFVTIVNKATAVQSMLAKANGVSAEAVEDWGRMLSAVGMDVNSVITSFGFLQKTMGAVKSGVTDATQLSTALRGVGLELNAIKDLSPEDQFKAVLQAAKDTEDAQMGAAAAVALFGRNAGKMVGYLRTQTGTIEELLEVQNAMNLQTDEGRDGAIRFFGALDHLEAAIASTKESLAGLIGEGVAPMLEITRDWIKDNQELIKLKIKEWADRITKALKTLWRWTKGLYTKISDLVDIFGGFENLARLVGIAIGSIMSTRIISMMVTFTNALIKAGIAATLLKTSAALISLAVAGTIILLGLLAEDLYAFFTGGDSLVGELGAKIAEFAHANIRPFIASLLGMTPEEFDIAVVKVVTRVQDFFTKDIPDAYNWFVDDFEKAIKLAIDGMYPVIEVLYDFFVEVLDKIIGYVGQTAGRIKDSIGAGFKNAIASIAGVDPTSIKDIIAGRASVSAQSALGAGPGAQLANMVKNTVNNAKATISQSNSINITQQPGESSDNLVRKMKDMLSAELTRATKAAAGGIS